MFETLTCRSKKGLDEFGVAKLAKETKSVAADVLVGVLQVHTDTVAAEWRSQRQGLVRELKQRPYQTRIISCFNLPPASCLGQTS